MTMPVGTIASGTAKDGKDRATVGMGETAIAAAPHRLTTILGSCIALVMYSPQHRVGMLSHVVLPHATGTTTYPAKFADTAVPHMLAVLQGRGIRSDAVIAKLAGGACMFGNCKTMQIGEANVQAAIEALAHAGVRVVAQDVGGTLGRRIGFDLSNGSITVECIGHPSHTI
jgi:chemotaxis protein CheD